MSPIPLPSDRASGLLSTLFGVAIVLVLITFAADVGFGLWVRTTVDAAAANAARDIAALPSGGTPAQQRSVLRRATASLGSYGASVRFTLLTTATEVEVRATAPTLGLLPRLLGGGSILRPSDRTAVVRREFQ
ncbi:MAG: hypothetical protein ACKOYM_10550 [Actinomycetes bacterium]